jgi:hypothetical protein
MGSVISLVSPLHIARVTLCEWAGAAGMMNAPMVANAIQAG